MSGATYEEKEAGYDTEVEIGRVLSRYAGASSASPPRSSTTPAATPADEARMLRDTRTLTLIHAELAGIHTCMRVLANMIGRGSTSKASVKASLERLLNTAPLGSESGKGAAGRHPPL